MSAKSQIRPPGSRRPPIFRVKTGCFTCRGRKKKCDEVKPTCSGCRRNKLNCRWPTSSQTTRKAPLPDRPTRSDAVDDVVASGSNDLQQLTNGGEGDDFALDTIVVSDGFSPETPSSSSTSTGHDGELPLAPEILQFDDIEQDEIMAEMFDDSNDKSLVPAQIWSAIPQSDWEPVPIPKNVSPFPCQDGRSLELLSHYLSRTALSMGNGSTDINPFISQLVPLSFANGLILDLVLCQSAVHRAMKDASKLQIAHGYYNKSLRMVRKAIQDYVDGQETNPLWIVVGALIMCFTETAKGDSQGTIFDHINGARPLLTSLLSGSSAISNDLYTFIIEYYIYTASVSMISIDFTSASAPFLSPELEQQAEDLVASGYVGQCCGGWLELLLLLPQIFRFGQSLRGSPEVRITTADDFVVFATLQARVLAFQPAPYLGSETVLCSEIFKQAVYLYLLTALPGEQSADGPLKYTIESTIDQAFMYFGQLPAMSRINTNLCWALAVIGSCVIDEARRDELRARLDIMFLMIGLGNIQATSTLLEHMWELPEEEQGPWAIWRVMQEKEVWISFA